MGIANNAVETIADNCFCQICFQGYQSFSYLCRQNNASHHVKRTGTNQKKFVGRTCELQDSKGRIQLYIKRDEICPEEDKTMYNTVFKRLLDIGDFIGVKGFAFRTQMGEISVHVKELTVLSKSLRPLPIVKEKDGVKYDEFNDPELRYRMRYVDLVVNDKVKDIFITRCCKPFRAVPRRVPLSRTTMPWTFRCTCASPMSFT